jgi:hypothetical protein
MVTGKKETKHNPDGCKQSSRKNQLDKLLAAARENNKYHYNYS